MLSNENFIFISFLFLKLFRNISNVFLKFENLKKPLQKPSVSSNFPFSSFYWFYFSTKKPRRKWRLSRMKRREIIFTQLIPFKIFSWFSQKSQSYSVLASEYINSHVYLYKKYIVSCVGEKNREKQQQQRRRRRGKG